MSTNEYDNTKPSPPDVVLPGGEVVSLSTAQGVAQITGVSVMLENGAEIPSPLPVAPPVGFTPGPDLIDQIRSMVRRELTLGDREELEESEDEAEDFDHPDLDEPFTRYEADGLSREEVLREAIRLGWKPPSPAPKPAADAAPGVSPAPASESPLKSAPAKPTVPATEGED